MKLVHTIPGKSELKPNYFAIGADSQNLISNAHSLASGEEQYETVKFWDLLTGDLVKTVDFRHDNVSVCAYEKWLLGIVYNADAILKLNLATDEFDIILDAAPHRLPEHKSNVTPLAASLYEPIFVCGAQPGEIAVYNLLAEPISTDGYAKKLPAQKFSSEYSSSNSSVIISPDSRVLLSQTLNRGFHHLWDISTGELIRTFNSSSIGLAEYLSISHTGQLLACGLFSEQIRSNQSILTLGSSIKFVAEVVSSNWQNDYARKVEDYAALGIPEYWIADYAGNGGTRYIGKPKQPTLSICTLVNGEYEIQQLRGNQIVFSPTFPGLKLTAEQVLRAGR